MRVYNRAMGGSSWVSVEDYLTVGNALGYNQNWRYRHTGSELLILMTARSREADLHAVVKRVPPTRTRRIKRWSTG